MSSAVCRLLVLKNISVANSVDPDETAEAVLSGSTVFACMPKLVLDSSDIFRCISFVPGEGLDIYSLNRAKLPSSDVEIKWSL